MGNKGKIQKIIITCNKNRCPRRGIKGETIIYNFLEDGSAELIYPTSVSKECFEWLPPEASFREALIDMGNALQRGYYTVEIHFRDEDEYPLTWYGQTKCDFCPEEETCPWLKELEEEVFGLKE